MKTWKDTPPAEKWKGPCQVLQTTHRAMELKGLDSLIHYTQTKGIPPTLW